jgi:REG-2-like HAD superfamily hydrolase
MDELFEELWELFARGEHWKLADQAVQTLTTLKDKNYRLAVLSNNDSRLRSVLRELQVDHLFEHLFISSELGFEKPQREIFQAVEETLEVTPQEIMHLGDSYSRDYLGAQESGWNPVLYGSDTQAKVHIYKFPELLNLLS